jgi:DNA-binding MarR family transcriptional regulator
VRAQHSPGERLPFARLQNRRLKFLRVHQVSREQGLSQPTETSVLKRLEAMGLVREITGKARDRVYVYRDYPDILEEGAHPL